MKITKSQILATILVFISSMVGLVVVFNCTGEASHMKYLITINLLMIANIIYVAYVNHKARKNYFNS